jgi:hypothetical protein
MGRGVGDRFFDEQMLSLLEQKHPNSMMRDGRRADRSRRLRA